MNEEEQKKKKPNMIIIIALIIIVLAVIGFIVFKIITKKEEPEDKFKNVVRDPVSIEKLNNFVNAAMYNDFGYEGLAYDFAKGIDKITNEQKIKIIFQSLINVKYELDKIDSSNIPEKYKNDNNINNPNAVMLSSRSFEKEYEKTFGEKPDYDENSLKEVKGCPSVYKYDSRVKKIFLLNDCKLEGDTLLLTRTFNYKFEDDYYYVYQYIGLMKNRKEGEEKDTYMKLNANEVVDVDDFSGHEKEFETLIWKFDKDYNFINTTYSK